MPNLAPLCRTHHLIVIHAWGWALALNPDGTTTATSPMAKSCTATTRPSRPPDPPPCAAGLVLHEGADLTFPGAGAST
jgi:hypothetical protein